MNHMCYWKVFVSRNLFSGNFSSFWTLAAIKSIFSGSSFFLSPSVVTIDTQWVVLCFLNFPRGLDLPESGHPLVRGWGDMPLGGLQTCAPNFSVHVDGLKRDWVFPGEDSTMTSIAEKI